MRRQFTLIIGVLALTASAGLAQTNATTPTAKGTAPAATTPPANLPAGVAVPADYLIGPSDQLSIVFWRDKDMSSDVSVRPDGKISLPLLNEVQASGLTPEQLRAQLVVAAGKFIEDPTVSVIVKDIRSRMVYITGQVGKAGPYPLVGPTSVLQLIATAGGLNEYADGKKIQILRTENGKTVFRKFNYEEFAKGKHVEQNIELKPGDTVLVP